MTFIALNQSSGCADPVLQITTAIDGKTVDVEVLEYQIWENVTTPGTPVQFFPDAIGGRASVNVDDDCPDGGRIGVGTYVAEFSPSVDAAGIGIGEYEIRWFFKLTAASPEQTQTEAFEVINNAYQTGRAYASVASTRTFMNIPASVADADILTALQLATSYIERITGRIFEPHRKVQTYDGHDQRELLLDEPIIAIETVEIEDASDAFDEVEPDEYRVYNRHLSENLLQPDDRDNPRIAWQTAVYGYEYGDIPKAFQPAFRWWPRRFPWGKQNVRITGTFGYTDPDGTLSGKTPDMIAHATRLLARRYLGGAIAGGGTTGIAVSTNVRREKTVDQEVEYFKGEDAYGGVGRGGGPFTGDPAIDQILLMYKRPAFMGSA